MARYARAFDLLEVSGEAGRHPRRPGLLEWRRSVQEDFVFSVVVPSTLASLEAGKDAPGLLSHARMVADALGATWWLLRTPPMVTPSARATRKLEALVADLRAEGRAVAWEPRGVWGDEGARGTAAHLDVHLVRDLAREEPVDGVDVIYTRLRALGEGARIGAAAAERVAERIAGATDAFVVVEGAGAGRVRQVLREMLGASTEATEGGDADEDADEDSEDDEEAFDDEDSDDEEDES